MNSIEVNHITKDYGQGKGVFDVSFTVNDGEVLGFLGPNGAGKTTTIRQLMGFMKPDKGTVSILGKDCFKDAKTIQENIGYLPGEITFMDDITGKEFIQFIADLKGIKDMSKAYELIEYFELNPTGKIKKMSKGMKQKIGLVCAFMQDPDIYIFDEPTSGLDPLMQNKFVDLVIKEKEKGKTILMSSHIFEEVEKTCDRVAIIKDGHIVAIDKIDNLKQNKVKHFSITFKVEKDALEFQKKYPDAILDKNCIQLKVKDITTFIQSLQNYQIKDLDIKTQTLEELFLHFYGGDKNA
ncbi:MAG: ABC transporter ATP-binding protein [Coprobacillus sp.]